MAEKLTERGRKTIELAKEKYAGKNTMSNMTSGHDPAAPGSNHQPKMKSASVVGETSERRRLSVIFQRCSPVRGLSVRAPAESSTRPPSHGKVCQSPRTHRCRREAAAR